MVDGPSSFFYCRALGNCWEIGSTASEVSESRLLDLQEDAAATFDTIRGHITALADAAAAAAVPTTTTTTTTTTSSSPRWWQH